MVSGCCYWGKTARDERCRWGDYSFVELWFVLTGAVSATMGLVLNRLTSLNADTCVGLWKASIFGTVLTWLGIVNSAIASFDPST